MFARLRTAAVDLLAGAGVEPSRGMRKPLAIDLFCGLGGWTDGLLAEGYDVVGFDIERHAYDVPGRVNGVEICKVRRAYPAQLVIQDVATLHGSQFRDADLIVASPPCQRYSYMAMPWSRAKAQAAEIRQSTAKLLELNRLFWTCFDLQAQASRAAGHEIPMVVENVKGAQPWVGRAAWHYGSFYLWGDVPVLMPMTLSARKVPGFNFHEHEKTGKPGRSFQSASVESSGVKQHGSGAAWFDKALDERRKGAGGTWFHGQSVIGGACTPRSDARKAASAMIAKIPLELSRYIASVYFPHAAHTAALLG